MFTGRQFYLLRKEKDMSREVLSKKLGVTINDIIMYENGIKEIPKDTYLKWVEIFKQKC